MPITSEHMDIGEWSVNLLADTPTAVLDAIDVRTYAYASIVITPQHFRPGDISDADLLATARYTGVYLAQSDRRLTLEGAGLGWWLGDETDGGDLYTGADGTSASLTVEAQLDARVFPFANGLTKGAVNANATARIIKLVRGTSRRQFLDTISALYADPDYEWRINPSGTVDVNTAATLWPTNTTPTTVLTHEGGREGSVTGVRAELDLTAIDVSDYRSDVKVNWDDTSVNQGSAANTEPAGWVDFAGGAIDITTMLTLSPKPFQDRKKYENYDQDSRAWRTGVNNAAARFGVWLVNAVAQANNLAKRHATATASYAVELDATIDEYDPWRFAQPGDAVYVYDLDQGLTNTANEVYYRGQVIHPTKLRVYAMTAPILDGYGVYLRYWTGAAFAYYDLTPYVAFEEDDTSYDLGTRARFHRRNARPRRINRAAISRRGRQLYRYIAHANG